MSDPAAWVQLAVRWVLCGFLLASIGGLANLNRLRPGERIQQAALGWSVMVWLLVSARLVTLTAQSDVVTIWSMRVQYAAVLMQVPVALHLIGHPRVLAIRRVAFAATTLVALAALAGPTVAAAPVQTIPDASGHLTRFASPGSLTLWVLPYTAGVGCYVARGAWLLSGEASRGVRRSLVAVVVTVIPAGANDCLMSLGVLHSFLMADIASCIAVLGLSVVLIHRTHAAYDDLLVAYAAQRAALEQTASEVRTTTRLAEHGQIVERVVGELQGPIRRVGSTLKAAEDALTPLFNEGGLDREGGPDQAELADMLREASDAATRIRSTVRALSEFSEVSAPRIAVVDVVAVLERALVIASNALRHRARVDLRAAARPHASADPDRLTRALVHALLSAARSIPALRSGSGRIGLSVEGSGATVRVHIEDNGIGIAEEELPLVFDPYAATRSLDRSPSLGLAVCHRVVTALGGKVLVESSEGGTQVTIELQSAEPSRNHAA